MRAAALNPNELAQGTVEGVVVMRGLLTPAECEELAPPTDTEWRVEEPEDETGRSWAHSPQYPLGSPAMAYKPNLLTFMLDFRALLQARAVEAGIPELRSWGSTPTAAYPAELLGFHQFMYAARWHRTPASHEIGWHTDDTFKPPVEKGKVGVRALGFMVAISLTRHGGAYEVAPAGTDLQVPASLGQPIAPQVRRIESISQGDAVGFCTARDYRGRYWPGSFPLHRFIADRAEPTEAEVTEELGRDSLILMYHVLSNRGWADLSLAGIRRGVRARLLSP